MLVGLDARALVSPVRSGVEVYVINLARALAQLSDAPDIIAYMDRRIAAPELAASLSRGRVRPKVLRAKRGWLRAALPWRLWRDGVDLVHLPSTIVPPLLPCPAVVTVHDLAWARYPETYDSADLRMQTEVVPRSVRRAAHVIAVSRSTARDVADVLQVPNDRITAIPLGVSAAFAPQGPKLNGSEFPGADRARDGCVLHTGGLHPRKNLGRLLEAYAMLRREGLAGGAGSAPPLLIAGDTSTRWGRELMTWIARLDLTPDVILPGHVTEQVLPALYRSATALVYPSLYEGFGLPILEAMASGTPVITSDGSSMLEVAGEAAVLVNPESAEELAGALSRVLTDEALRRDLAERGLLRSRQFTWERTARETVAVYGRLAHPL